MNIATLTLKIIVLMIFIVRIKFSNVCEALKRSLKVFFAAGGIVAEYWA